ETYGCLRGTRGLLSAAGRQLARRLAPIRGTPASRRSHRGDFGLRGRASPHWHLPDRSQRTPTIRVVVPGGGPLPPGATVASRRRRTPRLAPPSGCLRTTPLR